ncbi:MAG: hypothetical protein HY812_18530 [Planctomycetes bacterium]|nr:hypothetical protein [Planctomycetota bacterium]
MLSDPLRPLAACLFLVSSGCAVFSPEPPNYASIETIRAALESSDHQARPMPEHVATQQRILNYFPNRLLDIFDVFKFSLGLGPGLGVEIYGTSNAWISYLNMRTWRLALDGRASGFYEEGHYREWHLGDRLGEYAAAGRAPIWAVFLMRPFEAPLKPGVPAVANVPKIPWDFGLLVHLLVGFEFVLRPFEVWDLVTGVWGDDPAGDDYGVRHYPLHEYAPQENIVNLFIRAIDRLDDKDLRQLLSDDLLKRSYLRRGRNVVKLNEEGGVGAGASDYSSGDREQDYVIIDDVRLEPHAFRGAESNSLDFSVTCTGAKLRWGVPAQIDYVVSFQNRFLPTSEELCLTLRVQPKDGQNRWVVTEIEGVDAARR